MLKKTTLFQIIYITCSIILFNNELFGQLDNTHYFPPLHCRSTTELADHYLYLSTPESTPFDVNIYDGQHNLLATKTISNGNPEVYKIGDDGLLGSSKLYLPKSQLYTALSDKGLIVESNKKFFAEIRTQAILNYHASAFTGKGKSAAGKTFRVGFFPQFVYHSNKDFTVGIMSLEDNNTIDISDFAAGVTFETPTSTITPGGNLTITLNKGQTFVLAGYMQPNTNDANYLGFIGALIQSSKDIVVDVGNLTGNLHPTNDSKDYGLDELVPINNLGTEHIVVEGNGTAVMETPFIVAHYDNTQVFVNNNPTPIATLNGGDYFIIPNSNYQGTTHRNMFIKTSKPAYVFQALAGASSVATGDFNLIPPFHCRLSSEIDLIPNVEKIGSNTYSGGLFIVTMHGATVKVNGVIQNNAVPTSNNDYDTYKILGLTGNQKVESTAPVAAGIFGYSGSAAYSGYYSGFADRPYSELSVQSNELCQNEIDSLSITIHGGTSPYIYNYSINGNDFSETSIDSIITIPINTTNHGNLDIQLTSIVSKDIDGVNSCPYPMDESTTVVIKPLPSFNVGGDKEICYGETITLNATVNNSATVIWNGTINNNTSIQLPVGDSTFIANGTLDGCLATDSIHVLVKEKPNAQFTANQTDGCAPLNVLFTRQETISSTNCTWDFGNQTDNNCDSVSQTFTSPGQHEITLIVESSEHCFDTTSIMITVNQSTSIDAGQNQEFCFGNNIILNATASNGATITWDNNLPNGTEITPNVGTNSYIATADLNGCKAYDTLTVKVNSIPNAQFTANQTDGCAPLDVLFTRQETTSSTNCTWHLGNQTDNNCDNVSQTFTTPGQYEVTLVVESNEHCFDTTSIMITVNQSTSIDAGQNQEFCFGNNIILNATVSNGATITWDNNLPNGAEITPNVGTNSYIATADLNGCKAYDTLIVKVNSAPNAQFSSNIDKGCYPLTITFTSQTYTPNSNCLWDFGDGNTSTTCINTTNNYHSAGSYTVSYIITTDKGCSDTVIKPNMINIQEGPDAQFTAHPTITNIANPEVAFSNQSLNGTIYSWDFGDDSNFSNEENPSHSFPNEDAGEYTVTLYVTNAIGCEDSTFQVIIIQNPDPIYTVPNVFSPNGDGVNDIFKLKDMQFVDKVEGTILNRWGQVIYSSSGSIFEWNGQLNNTGTKCSEGVYFYKLNIFGINQNELKEEGFLHLMR